MRSLRMGRALEMGCPRTLGSAANAVNQVGADQVGAAGVIAAATTIPAVRDFVWADPGILQRRRRLLKVGATREVDAAADDVWGVVADHSTWPVWHADYDDHQPITAHDDGLGARFRTKEWVLRSESEISRWVPGRVLGLTVLRATAWRWLLRSYYTEISIEPIEGAPGRCRVRYDVAFTGTVLFWLLSAYAVGHALGSIYWNARASLANLDRFLADRI